MTEEITTQSTKYFHQFIDENVDPKEILDEIVVSAHYDGQHHKQWLIDHVVRCITGHNYEAFVKAYEEPIIYRDKEDDYSQETWDKGIAP